MTDPKPMNPERLARMRTGNLFVPDALEMIPELLAHADYWEGEATHSDLGLALVTEQRDDARRVASGSEDAEAVVEQKRRAELRGWGYLYPPCPDGICDGSGVVSEDDGHADAPCPVCRPDEATEAFERALAAEVEHAKGES